MSAQRALGSTVGFAVLGSILAQDRYLPRQLHTRGDRLAYSNGIVFLAVMAIILIAGHPQPPASPPGVGAARTTVGVVVVGMVGGLTVLAASAAKTAGLARSCDAYLRRWFTAWKVWPGSPC